MEKRGHIILAFIINFLFIYLTIYMGFSLMKFNFISIALVSLIIIFYSILPDIDHKNSTITWWFFGVGILGLVMAIIELLFHKTNPNPIVVLVLSTLFLLLTFLTASFFDHRGIIHTVGVGILAVIPVFLLFHSIGYCLIAYVSWHSHLWGDGYLFKIK